MGNPKTLAELSEESSIPARTIRFYIARGLLDGRVKAGRGAVYTAERLRLEKIQGTASRRPYAGRDRSRSNLNGGRPVENGSSAVPLVAAHDPG